jgi:hypothetical protein
MCRTGWKTYSCVVDGVTFGVTYQGEEFIITTGRTREDAMNAAAVEAARFSRSDGVFEL